MAYGCTLFELFTGFSAIETLDAVPIDERNYRSLLAMEIHCGQSLQSDLLDNVDPEKFSQILKFKAVRDVSLRRLPTKFHTLEVSFPKLSFVDDYKRFLVTL